MPNGKCYHHGGVTGGGGTAGNANAKRHGIYSDVMGADDKSACDAASSGAGGVEHELMVARVQLRRALVAQAKADAIQDGMEVCEVINRDGAENAVARTEVKSKRIDYPAIVNTLLGRIESLEKTRKELLAKSDPGDTGDAKTIICPDG
jgi:hypothetical protein